MKIIILICALSFTLGICSLGLAEDTKRVVVIAEVKGTVEVRNPKASWLPAKVGMILNQGDIVRAKANSFALLNVDGMAETATVEVKENSQIALTELLENKQTLAQTTLLNLSLGQILINAKKLDSEKSKFEVKTPTSIVAVRGTSFSVSVETIE